MELRVLKNGLLCVNDKEYLLENLYDDDFYDYSNHCAKVFYNETYAVNEMYDALVQKNLVLCRFIENQGINKIDLDKAPLHIKLILFDIAKRKDITVKGNVFWDILQTCVNYHILHFASFVYLVYLMLRIPHRDSIDETVNSFAVLREKAAINKFKNIELSKEIENPWERDSIYRLFSRFKRVRWVFKSYVRSFKSMGQIRKIYKGYTGRKSQYVTMDFYKKRIVHSELYGCLMDAYFQHLKEKTYYTGSNLDRFSIIEEQLAGKYGIKTICYPHGLEYGFRFPKGFSCDVFYATTEYAAKFLNNLYETKKFIFDESIISLMYRLPQKKSIENSPRKVVYFTEPREVEVNIRILEGLIPSLSSEGIGVFLKLHPGDKKDNYEGMNVTILTDYVEALTNVICVARKSTVLLEALYNNSVPIAILTNKKDTTIFNTFPSLNSDKIVQTHTVDELVVEINKHLN